MKELLGKPETQEVVPSTLFSEADIVVFDMDGTLYLLDGDDNGYHNSTLNKHVLSNTRRLIMEKEGVSEEASQLVIDDIFANHSFLSISLSEKYGISKIDVFNATWDIEPAGIVQSFEKSQKVVREISQSGKHLVLLTSAPKVWQEKVISLLELNGLFRDVYTAHDFKNNKEEIFSKISKEYPQKKIMSIGDQFKSDIEPAQKLGMLTYLVKHPDDLLKLINHD